MARGRGEAKALARAAAANEPAIRAPGPANPAARATRERFERAKGRRDMGASVIADCYEFALPLRQRSGQSSAVPLTDRLFDGTAVQALQGLASQTLDDVWPADQTPFALEPGDEVPAEQREDAQRLLAEVSETIIGLVNNSNFRSAAHECFLDYGIGTGVLLVEAGDALTPVQFRAVPLTECVLDTGPGGEIDALFQPRKIDARDITRLWPRATVPDDLAQRLRGTNGPVEIEVLEAVERDWSATGREVWVQRVLWSRDSRAEAMLEERHEGVGARPFLSPSFSRVAGETMGRGPVMTALPDIRTLNKLKELLLEHMDLQLSGVWLYDDDGVINPDTSLIEPGALIPRMPTSKGLENIAPAGSPQVAFAEAEQLRAAIREALFVNDLGDITKTPKSATEIMQRTADRARRLTGPYGRLLTEFLFPLVARVWWLLRRSRGANDLPPIDGDRIKVRPLSPLVWAQAQNEVMRHTQFLAMLQSIFGPQAAMVFVDQDKMVPFLARRAGFDTRLLRTKAEQQQLMQQMAQMAQQAGMMPGGAAPAAATPA